MAVQPLSSATDRRLGGPLPHQLPNRTRVHLRAINLWHSLHAKSVCYAVLASVSRRYSPLWGRLLTRYSPVRHWSEDRSPRHRSTWMCYARRQRSSWARIKLSKKLYNNRFYPDVINSSEWFCMLNYLKELSFSSKLICKFKRIFGVFFRTFVVVQFSMSDSLLLIGFRRQPVYYITSNSVCQVVSRKFFQTFFCRLALRLALCDLAIISHRIPFVKGFLEVF